MNSAERKRNILELLREKESVQVGELTELFNVSKVTIRTDLDDLEQKGLLVRTHGGAMIAERQELVRLISNTINECADKKMLIARMAASIITPGSAIIIDSGSTTVHLARYIESMPLTVMTNSVLVVQNLMAASSIELVVAGGSLRRQSLSLIGNHARECFRQVHADILFLGASGFSVSGGVFCTNLIEADTKRAMIDSAAKVCLMADSTKAGRTSLARICDWSSIDMIITDSISETDREKLESLGVTVVSDSVV